MSQPNPSFSPKILVSRVLPGRTPVPYSTMLKWHRSYHNVLLRAGRGATRCALPLPGATAAGCKTACQSQPRKPQSCCSSTEPPSAPHISPLEEFFDYFSGPGLCADRPLNTLSKYMAFQVQYTCGLGRRTTYLIYPDT